MSQDLDQFVAGAESAAFAAATEPGRQAGEREGHRFLGSPARRADRTARGPGQARPEARKSEGARINQVKQQVEAALTARRQ
ncbi:hypothetical protein ACTMU2_30165 [Cupriavidus basilensis]